MLAVFILLSFSLSKIPLKYQDLAKEALKSAQTKVPKELREDTKYPGVYEGENYHFKLTQILTNAKTNDIKGFSYNKHNCAIVKRKAFNISNGFAMVDPETQKLFLLKESVAEDGNVVIYDSMNINIFNIMTDFKLETSTDESITDLPIKSKYRSKRPKVDISYANNWNSGTNRPILDKISDDSEVQLGVGYSLKYGITTSFSFNSLWDVSIIFRIAFEGKFGAEVLIPDSTKKDFPSKELWSKKISIPRLGYQTKFLGLDISVGAFMNFVLEVTDISIEIPLGFDYFKGYQISATKYYEITPTSILDSKWDVNINNLPTVDSMKDVFKAIVQSIFRATLQFRPFLSLEFNVGALNTQLEAGLKFPFEFTFQFDKDKCAYPHLKGDLTFPMKMYFGFSGLQFDNYMIIDEAESEINFYTINFETFCIGSKGLADDIITPDTNRGYTMSFDDIYEKRSDSISQVQKQISFTLMGNRKDEDVIASQILPLAKYGDENQKSQKDRQFIFGSTFNLQKEMRWSLIYVDQNHEKQESNDVYVRKIDELEFDDANKASLEIELRKKENDDSDLTHFTVNIEKYPVYFENNVYNRNSKYVGIQLQNDFYSHYTLLVIDKDGKRQIDNNCIITPMNIIGEQQPDKGIIYRKNFNNMFQINVVKVKEENIRIIYDVVLKYDGEKETVVASFISPLLTSDNSKNYNEKGYVYFHDGDKIFLKGTIYSDNSKKEFKTDTYLRNDENTDQTVFNIGESAEFTFTLTANYPLLQVETSYTNTLSEVFVPLCKVNDYITSSDHNIFEATIHVDSQIEKYKILRFDIPEKYRNEKLYITIGYTFYQMRFADENVLLLNDYRGIVDINGRETVDVIFSKEPNKYNDIEIQFYYIRTSESGLIIQPEGNSFTMIPEIYNAMMIPFFYGHSSVKVFFKDFDENNLQDNVVNTNAEIDGYSFMTFSSLQNEHQVAVYLTAAGIGDQEPHVTVDFTGYQIMIDKNGYFDFTIHTPNGAYIRMEKGSDSVIQPLVKERAVFQIDYTSSPITFYAVCHDNTEKACEIEYPAPEQTGFHLIRYPNRDGISITGRGFLAEAIPVEKGKSFIYSKTYEGAIEKYREYSSDPIKIKVKIIDNRNANYMEMKRTRKICLADSLDNFVPFSRKFVTKDVPNFLEMIGVSKDIDMNYFHNDENGCILFDPQYITSDDFTKISAEACDLNVDGGITEVDDSLKLFGIGGSDPKQKKKTIIIIVVVVVVVVLVVVGVVVFFVIRRKKMNNEDKDDGSEMEGI